MQPVIRPSISHLEPGSRQTFAISGTGSSGFTWLVNGVPGGNRKVGTVTPEGQYCSPAKPTRGEILIEARASGGSPRRSWATVVFDSLSPFYRIQEFWDRKGEGEGRISTAHSICTDGADRLLIVDTTLSRIFRFTCHGDYLGEIGSGQGSGPGQLDGPRDAKVSRWGEIYVTDGNNGRIQVFDRDGRFLRSWARKGKAEAELLRPHALDIAPDGSVFVVDVDNSKVVAYDNEGRLLRSWGRPGTGPGEFQAPHGLAVDPNGDVFVAEYHGRVQKFTPEGQCLASFANPCREGQRTHGDYKYHAMNSDAWGNVYLMARDSLEGMVNSIDKYNNSGDFVARLTASAGGRQMTCEAAAVNQAGMLYVADSSKEHAGVSIFVPC